MEMSCKCHECGSEIDEIKTAIQNAELFNAIETGAKEDLTDLEMSLYYGVYCEKCATKLTSTVVFSLVAGITGAFYILQEYFQEFNHIAACHVLTTLTA